MDSNHLKKIALLGLERSPLDADTFAALEELGIETTGDAAHDLLSGLGALYLLEKTAAKLPEIELKTLPALEEEEDRSPISEDAMRDFEVLAAGVYPEALPVFVQTMEQEKLRFPYKMLPLVLDRCARQHWLFRAIYPILGARAFWLIKQNDEWRPLLKVNLEKGKTAAAKTALKVMDDQQKAKLMWFIEKMMLRLQG